MNEMLERNRVGLTDTMEEAIYKISEGVPGAIVVCAEIIKKGNDIDPDNILGGLGVVLTFDDMGIYGSRIWMLFKDVCGQNLSEMLCLLRANQLGYVSQEALQHAIDNYGDGLDLPALYAQVQERLPEFKLEQ